MTDLDNIPYYDENGELINNINAERDEQYLANKWINEDCKILELGARYGTVSCLANNKLNNPYNHVVVEPDSTVIEALKKNRDTHNSYFSIYNGIISNIPMHIQYDGYGTRMNESGDGNETKTEHMTLHQFLNKYPIDFNTIIADCEGCFPRFVRENPGFVKSVNIVMMEKDQGLIDEYNFVEDFLEKNNFQKVDSINDFQVIYKRA